VTEPKPDTLNYTKTADGVQITLLKPPIYRRSRSDLISAIGVSVGILLLMIGGPIAAAVTFEIARPFLVLTPIIGIFTVGIILSQAVQWNRETAVLDLAQGFLTFVRSGSDIPKQWAVREVRTVRAWYLGLLWELQIELRSGEIVHVLKGRSRLELQLASALLRDALKMRPAPTKAPEMEFASISGGECQICGANMTDHVVFCSKCRTPHHEECWSYNGACSTYGCREIRYTRTA
jgi:hypothetical protein